MSDVIAPQLFLDGKVALHAGDCRDALRSIASESIDAAVTDPPYALVSIAKRFGKPGAAAAKGGVYRRAAAGFMGKRWDTGETAFAESFWREVLRVLKPGGHVAAFGGTRSYHRLACAIEDAGFEIRDQLSWLYGSGFPKSHDVSKQIDKAAGAKRERIRGVRSGVVGDTYAQDAWSREFKDSVLSPVPLTDAARQWNGWGTALKPALEPIVLARKPLVRTVAANVLRHGTGAINVAGCGIPTDETVGWGGQPSDGYHGRLNNTERGPNPRNWRWPANVLHDGSDEVVSRFPESEAGSAILGRKGQKTAGIYGAMKGYDEPWYGFGDSGSAARFFYTAKADAEERLGSSHPTVKPVDLMQWLVRLVTPPGGLVLDPFAGTGTTGEAAWREGMRAVLIERESEYQQDIARRMAFAATSRRARREEAARARAQRDPGAAAVDELPLLAMARQDAEGE